MKSKLLKRIRKRYSIHKVSELPSNADDDLINAEEDLGLPFYIVRDKGGWHGESCHKELNDAKDKILSIVLIGYSEQFRHKPGKIEKVWWVK